MPIGIQTFEKIIMGEYAYADKTALVYGLANEGTYFFLGRPRRFGKSLLVSTLRAYFEGKKDLFAGLAIGKLEKEWPVYPVLHIDLTTSSYDNVRDLESGLDTNLSMFEERWGIDAENTDQSPSARFHKLIRRACERSGQKVVVLIDEYDRPMTQTMEQDKPNDDIRNALKGFYGVLKGADRWLRFVLLTGVTKFSKVSVFSDLNMLRDISMENAYSGICGISAKELEDSFGPELKTLAENNNMSYEETVAEMKKRYDGYHFSKRSEGMFNPFSVLNTLAKQEFAYYWFETGTPTFLVDLMKQGNFDPLRFTGSITISARLISDYRADSGDPVPLLYQSGYLTIAGYDRETGEYILDFPNEEVRYGFLEELLPAYTYAPPGQSGLSVIDLFKDLRAGDIDSFMKRMRSLFANIPYELSDKTERHYQVVFFLVATLLGQFTRAEVHDATGRADMVVWTVETVYVFEFKLNGTAEDAMKQIGDKTYTLPYEAGSRKTVKIGAEFDKSTRNVERWIIEDPRASGIINYPAAETAGN
jgi:hypothetical protein